MIYFLWRFVKNVLGKGWSFIIPFSVMLWPPLFVAERQAFYTFPVAVLMVSVAYGLYKSNTTNGICLAMISAALISLTRSFYHPVFWCPPILLFCAFLSGKKAVWIFAVFLSVLVNYPCINNQIRYGTFTPSTWQGMNIFRTTAYIDKEETKSELYSGTISEISIIPPFSKPETYHKEMIGTGIPVLDKKYKSNGSINYNWIGYVDISKQYQKSAIYLLKEHPAEWFKCALNSAYIFCSFDTYLDFRNPELWNVHILRVFRIFLIPLFMFFAILISLLSFIKRIKNPMFMFITYTVLYTVALSCLGEFGEASTMRIPIDTFIILGCFLSLYDFYKTLLTQNNLFGKLLMSIGEGLNGN